MHPYLLEYPLDPETQDYRMDEELITCSGKTLLLDQMLPELRKRGHKVKFEQSFHHFFTGFVAVFQLFIYFIFLPIRCTKVIFFV